MRVLGPSAETLQDKRERLSIRHRHCEGKSNTSGSSIPELYKLPVNMIMRGPADCLSTFSDGRAGRALLVLQPDLFQSYQVVG